MGYKGNKIKLKLRMMNWTAYSILNLHVKYSCPVFTISLSLIWLERVMTCSLIVVDAFYVHRCSAAITM
jgi:hypothetical protein